MQMRVGDNEIKAQNITYKKLKMRKKYHMRIMDTAHELTSKTVGKLAWRNIVAKGLDKTVDIKR